MKIAVDKNAPIPAYKQVVDGIASAITRGDVERGSRLPSVRNLALDLGLNVNTVARAYRDLERAGVIDTMPGMGTFVADEAHDRPGRSPDLPGSAGLAQAIRGTGHAHPSSAPPVPTTWRGWLQAAWALARAERVDRESFLKEADAATAAGETRPLLLVAGGGIHPSDLVRALPADLASRCHVVDLGRLPEAAGGRVAVLTAYPLQAEVRTRLSGRDVEVVPLETEFSEETVRGLADLPPEARLALVAVDRASWDQEANDVMKIVGRSRWLKMVILEAGDRGLGERLAQVDAVLHVPRAREQVEAAVSAQMLVELSRQVTERTRERAERAIAGESR